MTITPLTGHLRTMRYYLFPAFAALIGAGVAGAQTTARVTAGVTGGTALVHDELGGPISLGAGRPVTIALAITHPIGAKYRLLIEGRVGRANVNVDDSGVQSDLESLTTVGAMLLVDGPFAGAFRWEIGAGVLSYRPADQRGVFLQGGPSPWLLGAGLSWSRPTGGSGLRLLANARYDFHQFQTRQLESRGYSQYRTVHRVGLGVGIERRF